MGWALGIAIPLVIALGDRAQTVLESWQEWLAHNNATVMLVLFAMLAAKMLGADIATLSA